MFCETVGQNLGDYSNNNGSSSSKYSKFISVFVTNKSDYFEQLTTMLEIININVNNMTDKINKFVIRNSGNYNNGKGNSNIRHLKFISFFVNNKSGYSE